MRHETAAGSMPAGGTSSASNPWKCKALHIQSDCGNRLLWRRGTSEILPSPHQRQSGGPPVRHMIDYTVRPEGIFCLVFPVIQRAVRAYVMGYQLLSLRENAGE